MAKLVGTVTQGSADAFAEASIVTGLSLAANTAWRVGRITFEIGAFYTGNGIYWSLALSRGSKSAMPNITDRDVIALRSWGQNLTTSGAVFIPGIYEYLPSPDEDIIIVEENLYFQIDTSNTSGSNTARVCVEVESRRITDAQRNALLAGRVGA